MAETENKLGVLFVCLGNICRSPMAEGAFRLAAKNAGLTCEVDSAGTAGYHVGDPPDWRAVKVAAANCVDISAATGRQLTAQDFDRFSHIFALDKANLAGIKAMQPRGGRAQVAMLMDAVKGREGEAVKDPYYGNIGDFEAVWAEVTQAADVLVARFKADAAAARL